MNQPHAAKTQGAATEDRAALTVDQGLELARDLVRTLTPLSGDRAAVNEVLGRWLDVLDAGDLSLVCTAAVQLVFTECLTLTPIDQMPPNQLALVAPNERKSR